MRVLHIIPSIARSYGGPARSVQGLVAAENEQGVEAWLMSCVRFQKPWHPGVRNFFDNSEPGEGIAKVNPDIVHLHGLWDMGLHEAAVICRRWNIPYVIAPRGMMEPWSLRQKWIKKRIARFLYQDYDLKHAAAIHVTAESEGEQLRKLGFMNPMIVSPNGVNVPIEGIAEKTGRQNSKGKRRALFVGRMHPKKGILELVESWARTVKGRGWECELVYTMREEAECEYERKVRARVQELGVKDEIIFTGSLDDDRKWEAYARADLFVLPTYSENFGIVVAEALYAGLPVITTQGTPWAELGYSASSGFTSPSERLEERCGWWIKLPESGDTRWAALDAALREATETVSSQQLAVLGRNGRSLVQIKYLWSAVVQSLIKGYGEILNR